MDFTHILHQNLQFRAIISFSMYILIGKVFKELANYLVENGIDYVAFLDETKKNVSYGNLDPSKVEYVDFEDFDALVERSRPYKDTLEAFLCVYDRYVLTLSRLAEALGVPGINKEAALGGTDKFYMREEFEKYDTNLNPDFAEISSEESLVEFMDSHEFPLILKPTNMSKSLFVTKNHSREEMLNNYREMMKQLPKYINEMTVEDDIGVIAEEFMQGMMHTVAGFADGEGNHAVADEIGDIMTGIDIGQTENYLYSRQIPSSLPQADQDALKETGLQAMRALKMRNCVAHIDLMLTPKGPRIIEIGTRPGGYRARMYGLASGFDFFRAYLDASAGRSFDITSTKHHATSTIEIFPERRGTVTEITSKHELEALPTLKYLSYRIPEGKEAGLPSQGFKSSVIVTLGDENPKNVFRDKKFIDDNVRVVTD